jgi:hypothetical protein
VTNRLYVQADSELLTLGLTQPSYDAALVNWTLVISLNPFGIGGAAPLKKEMLLTTHLSAILLRIKPNFPP